MPEQNQNYMSCLQLHENCLLDYRFWLVFLSRHFVKTSCHNKLMNLNLHPVQAQVNTIAASMYDNASNNYYLAVLVLVFIIYSS